MRNPAVLALHALHLTPGEAAAVLAGQPIRRRFWPPQHCQGGVVVGLCAGGEVLGEARLERVEPDREAGGVWWHFGPVTRYARALPHPASLRSRAMASPMPPAPLGTLTPEATAAMW